MALPGPSVTASVEFLVVAVLYISISFWIAFADRGVKSLEKKLMLVGMIIGLLVTLELAMFSWITIASVFNMGQIDPSFNPILFNNLSTTSNLMLMAAGMLFVAILGFVLIPRRKSIFEWIKAYNNYGG
jgi:magnesium-transporting ATPase (P-type)